jgi:hypothetical protein
MTVKKKPATQTSTENKERSFFLNKNIFWMIAAAVLAIMLFYFLFLDKSPNKSASTTAPQLTNVKPDPLVGSWIRPDGGYQLEIRAAQKDGTLDVSYLNPQPINVSRAEWRQEGTSLKVLVVLNDVNYPGSTYTLDYLSDQDRLVGNYFQAVYQENYYVEFVRNE